MPDCPDHTVRKRSRKKMLRKPVAVALPQMHSVFTQRILTAWEDGERLTRTRVSEHWVASALAAYPTGEEAELRSYLARYHGKKAYLKKHKGGKILVNTSRCVNPGITMFRNALKAMTFSFHRELVASTVTNSSTDEEFTSNVAEFRELRKRRKIALENTWAGDELCCWQEKK